MLLLLPRPQLPPLTVCHLVHKTQWAGRKIANLFRGCKKCKVQPEPWKQEVANYKTKLRSLHTKMHGFLLDCKTLQCKLEEKVLALEKAGEPTFIAKAYSTELNDKVGVYPKAFFGVTWQRT